MKVYTMVLKYDDAVLGRILTNHGLTIDEALNLLDIDMDKYAEEQGWEGWDYERLSFELEEDKKVAYTDYETYMASEKARVVWSGEYAGFDFSILDYGEDAGKPGRCYRFTEICFDKYGVERGWCDIDEDGYEGMSHEGFPFTEGFELPDGMTEKGLEAFFSAQPKEEAFRALWED